MSDRAPKTTPSGLVYHPGIDGVGTPKTDIFAALATERSDAQIIVWATRQNGKLDPTVVAVTLDLAGAAELRDQLTHLVALVDGRQLMARELGDEILEDS